MGCTVKECTICGLQVFIMPRLVGLVMEFIPDGDLLQYLKRHGRLKEEQARWVFQQVPCLCLLPAFVSCALHTERIHAQGHMPCNWLEDFSWRPFQVISTKYAHGQLGRPWKKIEGFRLTENQMSRSQAVSMYAHQQACAKRDSVVACIMCLWK